MKKVSNAQSASVSLPGVAHARQATLLMCAWHSNAGTFFQMLFSRLLVFREEDFFVAHTNAPTDATASDFVCDLVAQK